jgi:hypothetical protein
MENLVVIEQSQIEEDEYFQELFPAVHYIFYGEPHHKRMPLPSGLGHPFSKEILSIK